uniref:Peptide deformylase n=1 Tax=Oncorhynchus tshawytscha TaxID=74940 RepID=A0A8C8J4N3_ONCTS
MLDHSLPAAHEMRVLDGRTVNLFLTILSSQGITATMEELTYRLNEKAEPVTWQVSGWPAHILQLEMDHLDGVRYIDRMDSKTFNVKWAAQNE